MSEIRMGEWTGGFVAIPMMIFIPAHHIVNIIALRVKLINSQLNRISYRIRKTLVHFSYPEYGTIGLTTIEKGPVSGPL
jgi:hypothetical protein